MKKLISLVLCGLACVGASISAFATENQNDVVKKNDSTEVVFIMDKSGSMNSIKDDAIGSYNSFIEKQKDFKDETIVSVAMFNDKYDMLYNGVTIDEARITKDNYSPRGCTALLDALGKTITDVKSRYDSDIKAGKGIPKKTIVVVMTDGYENASREYNLDTVKKLISECEKENNWEFVFLGANIDTFSTCKGLGINPGKSINFDATSLGVRKGMNELCSMVADIRSK